MASAQSSKIARRQRQSNRNGNRLRLNLGENIDSYSCGVDLHDDLVETIFTYLPIKECVQIGLVAKKYRRTWRKCRNLTFGREFGATRADRMWYIHVVGRVFDLHVGKKIETLRLHFDPSGVEHLLDKWVRTSIEKGVEELDLDIYQGTVPFCLPTKLADEATLKVLTLNYSVLQMPYNMKALSSLTSVILRQVDLTARIVEALFENCVHLETFDMADCYGVRNLRVKAKEHKRFRVLTVGGCPEISSVEIDAPRLRCLYYSGVLVSRFQICEPLLLLDEAILNFRPSRGLTNPSLVEKLVADISRATVLTISSTFLEGLAAKNRYGCLRETQFCFPNLVELQVVMVDPSFANVGDIASFIKNCPNLEILFVDLNEYKCESTLYWESLQKPAMDQYMSFLNTLKFVKIRGFRFTKQDVQLAKFILDRAMFLESMVLVWPKTRCCQCRGFAHLHPHDKKMYTQFLEGWRLSPTAEISLCDQIDDLSSYPKHFSKKWC